MLGAKLVCASCVPFAFDMFSWKLTEFKITTLQLYSYFSITVYYQNITCADGFYLLNYTCRPHCTEFEQIDHNDAQIQIGFWYFATISNIIIIILFIVTSYFKRQSV